MLTESIIEIYIVDNCGSDFPFGKYKLKGNFNYGRGEGQREWKLNLVHVDVTHPCWFKVQRPYPFKGKVLLSFCSHSFLNS